MDWKLVVQPEDNIPPNGHKMETDAREYLEAKKAAALQRSASGSTLYMKDPTLRLPSRTEGRSQRPLAVQLRYLSDENELNGDSNIGFMCPSLISETMLRTEPDVAINYMQRGLRPGSCKLELVKKKITTLTESLREAEAFIHAKEVCAEAKHPETKKTEEAVHPKKNNPKKAENWALTSMTTSSKRSKRSEPATSVEPIEFSKDQYSILMEIKDQHAKALEDLAGKGKMNSYLSQGGRKFQKRDDRKNRRKESESTDEDVVLVISGGFAAGGPTNRGYKNYLRELGQIMLTNQAESDPFPKVVVSELDRRKIRTPHEDPLVVEMKIANLRVRRILIDTRSSTNIISADYLSRLKFKENDLVPVHHPIIGFGGGIIHPMGTVTLPVRVGDKEASRTLFVKFLVVRDLTAYNVILGRPTLNHIKAVIVTHLMLMKFECDGGRLDPYMEISK
ncbi:uncharacterized protein LOC130590479 [Beta vulgaris subsp. vulgaris]|uniref:uncharacterized protein LOC130590479 n=1 Tax=Beta vulgaris subsp. vulgaris TaxID=3555 RepID=UPI0025494880|nr:uncharacterized protein LOC130590479 [Beta vulgaris subsp. vulgaris]